MYMHWYSEVLLPVLLCSVVCSAMRWSAVFSHALHHWSGELTLGAK